jgi:hypothetical protein
MKNNVMGLDRSMSARKNSSSLADSYSAFAASTVL